MEKFKKYWLDFFSDEQDENNWWERKQTLWEREKGSIIRIRGKGAQFHRLSFDDKQVEEFLVHLSFLIRQKDHFHLEEQIVTYQLEMKNDEIMELKMIEDESTTKRKHVRLIQETEQNKQDRFTYDRREAVRYAERWWNSYNPDFEIFEDDCTNYISQCLLAGGAPMRGAPVRDQGWWYQNNNWSFSWSVAHSLRWYLSGSTQGLQGKEVDDPEGLLLGDVICYDFQGDGRWDHNTIVVAKDAYGMPLVNAHTNNSRNRYWSYEDSAAWTPNIQYKFFRIGE